MRELRNWFEHMQMCSVVKRHFRGHRWGGATGDIVNNNNSTNTVWHTHTCSQISIFISCLSTLLLVCPSVCPVPATTSITILFDMIKLVHIVTTFMHYTK